MKNFCTRWLIGLPVLLMVSGLNFGSLDAQDKDERKFGNGRFLRRLRDEISDARKEEREAKAKKAEAKARQKQAEAARSKTGPQLANRPALNGPATAPGQSVLGAVQPPARQADLAGRLPTPPETRSGKKQTAGFGMSLQLKKERLVVTRVDSRGNAKQAGIRTGDIILSGGGVEFTSMEEFNQISEVLTDGDQLEFEIDRRGDKQTTMIQFGAAPDPESLPTEAEAVANRNQVNQKDNYSFLPPRDSGTQPRASNLTSVLADPLDRPQSNTRFRPSSASQSTTIEAQQREIERLRLQLKQLQSQRRGAPIGSSLRGPTLSGPGSRK